jgi:hypothetical protein
MEEVMKNATRLTVAAIALLSGISVAGAAGMSKSKPSTTGSASPMSQPVKDKLTLSSNQRKTAWQDISSQATRETAPASFSAKVGAAVPGDLTTHPVPVSTASKVPALRPYQYALLNSNKLLIVNPDDRKVVKVITQ